MIPALLVVAAAALAATDLLNPQWNPAGETVSRYVNGTHGWLVPTATIAIAAASALAVRRAPATTRTTRAGRAALAVWAAALLVAAAFPADPPGRYDHPSTAELVHGTAALVAFAAFAAAAPLLSRRRTLALTAAASVLLTAAFAACLADVMDAGPTGPGHAIGAVERALIAANLLWVHLATRRPGIIKP